MEKVGWVVWDERLGEMNALAGRKSWKVGGVGCRQGIRSGKWD